LYKNFIFTRIIFTHEVIEKEPSTVEEQQAFLNDVVNYIKTNKMSDYIYKPSPNSVFKTYPKNCDSFRWASYVLDLENNLEDMLSKMTSSSQRRNTRKAIKDGVQVELTDDAEEVYNICNGTLLRQKVQISIDKNEFMTQFKNFHPHNMLMFKASYNNKVEGAIVIFKDDDHAYAEYSGSIPQPRYGLMKLLDLIALKHLVDNHNIKTFDLIGAIPDIKEDSKEARFQKSKKDLGAKLKEGYQFSLVINPLKYKIFNILLKTKFKIKGVKYIDPIEKNKQLSKSRLAI